MGGQPDVKIISKSIIKAIEITEIQTDADFSKLVEDQTRWLSEQNIPNKNKKDDQIIKIRNFIGLESTIKKTVIFR